MGHLSENFHPISFSQHCHSSPQFSSFQSETPVFGLWDSEYTCLAPLGAVFCHFEDLQWFAPEPVSIPIYNPTQGATSFCFMRSANQFPSSKLPWVSLHITQSHSDTSRGGWGEIQMIWWDKRGILHAPYEHEKLTSHPVSKSTMLCHMAGVVCLLKPGFTAKVFRLSFCSHLPFTII